MEQNVIQMIVQQLHRIHPNILLNELNQWALLMTIGNKINWR